MVTPPEEDMLMVDAEKVGAGGTADLGEDGGKAIREIVVGMIPITAAINGTKIDVLKTDCTRLRMLGFSIVLDVLKTDCTRLLGRLGMLGFSIVLGGNLTNPRVGRGFAASIRGRRGFAASIRGRRGFAASIRVG